MDYKRIGSVIKELREYVGLTQKDLADGICTQAQISKLENNKEIPSSVTLYLISKRLGVDLNYFFNITSSPRFDYIEDFKNQVRSLIRERNYEQVLQIVKDEKNNPLFHYDEDIQFLLWHEAICEYYINKNATLSLEKLYKALSITKSHHKYNEREIEILNSIGLISYEINEYSSSKNAYNSALHALDKLPQVQDKTIRIRVLYNLAKCLTALEEYQKSLECCNEGKQLCLSSETLYLMGELCFQKGRNLIKMNKYELGMESYEESLWIFKLIQNKKFEDFVLMQIENAKKEHTLVKS